MSIQRGVKMNHRHPRGGRRALALLAGVATILSVLVLSPITANAAPSAASLDQCADGTTLPLPATACSGSTDWVNGDLNEAKSIYREGDSVPFRMLLSGLSGPGSHSLIFQWDTTKSGKHAYDYLTTYNRTVSGADPCAGVSGCGSPATFPIPPDTHDPKAQVAGDLTCFNCTITTVSAPTLPELGTCSAYDADAHYALCGNYRGDSSTAIKLTFTTSVDSPVIAWGGHIASELIWGEGQGAGAIPGSPYHMRLISLDGTGGNQDRSLKASAVLQPPTITTQVSATQVISGQSVTDLATLTGSKGTVTGTVTFFLCGPTVSATPCTGGTSFGPVTLSGGQATSPPMSPAGAGTYCLRLEYIPDATALYSEGQSTSTTNECFTVIDINPSIVVLKTPDEQTVVTGSTVTFHIKVTNTGDTTLTNVHVTDAQAPNCARTSAQIAADRGSSTFAPTDTYEYDCTKADVTTSFTNTATATGTPPVGPDATDSDDAHVTVIHPSIDVQKTPDSQQVQSGGTVTFTITVTNTGDVALDDVSVTDAQAPNCAKANLGTLAKSGDPGNSTSYQCTLSNVQASFTNTAQACGTPTSTGPPAVCDTDTADVTLIHPAISVEKGPESQSVVSGNTVSFSIKVTNTGDTTLTNVHVTDAQAPNCARTSAQIAADRGSSTFAPGASYTYSCTLSVTSPLINTAQACGTPPVGQDVCDTDDAHVGIEHQSSYPDYVPNDFADISVDGSSVPLNGNLKFALYKGNCTGANQLFTQTVNVNGDGSYETTNTELISALIGSTSTGGTYNWQLTYSGDTNGNADINGACGTESFTITNGADAP